MYQNESFELDDDRVIRLKAAAEKITPRAPSMVFEIVDYTGTEFPAAIEAVNHDSGTVHRHSAVDLTGVWVVPPSLAHHPVRDLLREAGEPHYVLGEPPEGVE